MRATQGGQALQNLVQISSKPEAQKFTHLSSVGVRGAIYAPQGKHARIVKTSSRSAGELSQRAARGCKASRLPLRPGAVILNISSQMRDRHTH